MQAEKVSLNNELCHPSEFEGPSFLNIFCDLMFFLHSSKSSDFAALSSLRFPQHTNSPIHILSINFSLAPLADMIHVRGFAFEELQKLHDT